MGVDITRQRTSQVPVKGSSVKLEPFEHLFQHIKQSDPMLYEALKRVSRYFSDVENTLTNVVEPKFDKATFGLQKTLGIAQALTNYYICRKAGAFIDLALKNKVAPDSSTNFIPTILDILLSTDDGTTWKTIFNSSSKITIASGSVGTLVIPKEKFSIPAISLGNLLRIDCTQIALPNPGLDIEVVLRWE